MKHLAKFLALRLCVSSLIIGVGVVGCRANVVEVLVDGRPQAGGLQLAPEGATSLFGELGLPDLNLSSGSMDRLPEDQIIAKTGEIQGTSLLSSNLSALRQLAEQAKAHDKQLWFHAHE